MYHDLLEQLKDFTDEQFGKFTRILIRYDKDGIIPEFDDLQLKLAFQMLKPNMDRNKEKYEETCEQRRIAGSLGGKQKAINLANATKCYQNLANLPNLADNDIENDIDIKKDIIKEKECKEKEKSFSASHLEIFDYWNTKDIIQHKELTEKIDKAITKALKTYSVEQIKKCIDRYSTVIKDKSWYFDTKWSLDLFITQKNAIPEFTDEGSKWLNYINKKQSYQQKEEVKCSAKQLDNGVWKI